jgi:hypothetical protein
MGMAMGNMMMAQSGPWGAAPHRPPLPAPPPPPVEHVWHIAENGQTKGPFSKADLGRHGSAGQPDAGNPCLDRRSGRLDAGRGRARTGAAFHRAAAAPAAAASGGLKHFIVG